MGLKRGRPQSAAAGGRSAAGVPATSQTGGMTHEVNVSPDSTGRNKMARRMKVIGVLFGLIGAALLARAFVDLVRGGGADDWTGLALNLIPGPCFVLTGLFCFARGQSMEPAPFDEFEQRSRDISEVFSPGHDSYDAHPDGSSGPGDANEHPSVAAPSSTSSILGTGHAPAQHAESVPKRFPSAPMSPPLGAPVASMSAQNDHGSPSAEDNSARGLDTWTSPPAAAPPARGHHTMSGPESGVVDTYRTWVLAQALGSQAFQPLSVNDRYDEWFLMSASGVASLLAWTHEDHGATYSAETWVDQILPTQGIAVADRQLAMDLMRAAALYAGGLHTIPTERLAAYHPADLVTAMGTLHVGLLRLYSTLEGVPAGKVLSDQFGAPALPVGAPSEQTRWLPPGG